MHPAMYEWLRHARRASQEWGAHAGIGASHCGPGGRGPDEGGSRWERHFGGHHHEGGHDHDDDMGGGSLGVKRPLRFLAHKLDLDDRQVGELAAILSDLKTERAQAAVDHRRSTAAFADTVAGDTFDETKVMQIATERVKTAERLRDALVRALGRIHALLTSEQRAKLAYLIRTGALSL
jgi:Spy/CpxP family protein refolding chaperone